MKMLGPDADGHVFDTSASYPIPGDDRPLPLVTSWTLKLPGALFLRGSGRHPLLAQHAAAAACPGDRRWLLDRHSNHRRRTRNWDRLDSRGGILRSLGVQQGLLRGSTAGDN